MIQILSLVNTVSSTSIPVEIAGAVNEYTKAQVTIGAIMEDSDSGFDPDIESMDLPVVCFRGRSNFDYRGYQKLWSHLRTESYDVIHTHHNFSGSVSRLLGRIEKTPIVNTEHNDLRYFTVPQRIANTVTFGLPDVNVYNSNSTKLSRSWIAEALSNRDEVIYNGIDIERIEKGRKYSLPVELPDGILITNVGVITDQKNQRAILEAAHKIQQQTDREDIHFVIVGSGPLIENLKTKAEQLQIDDLVYFTGYLPEREQVYKVLHQSDVFVTPSIYEGFCVAAVEAMAAGLPVVVSDIDVFHEVVGSPGIFVESNDTAGLAREILRLVNDPPQRERLGIEAKERARSTFSLDRTAREYYNIYKQLAESSEQ